MNLLFTITAYPPSVGGAQIHTHRLVQNLSENHRLKVVAHWDSNRTDWLLGTTIFAPSQCINYMQDGIQVYRLGFSLSEKLKMALPCFFYYPLKREALSVLAANLEQHIQEHSVGIDLIHNVRIGREPLSLASLRIAHKQDIPFVFSPLHHPRWSSWLYRDYHQIYRNSDALIALTEVEKRTLNDLGVDEKKIFVTGIGPILADNSNSQNFREKYNLREDPIVLFLGQKYSYKGIGTLLEAAKYVWKVYPSTRFVFIGPRTKYSRKIFKRLDDSRVIEMDKVDLQTKTNAIAACSLLCVPSSQESFGGVYTEAWSLAKPVIGMNIPAVAEVIENGVNGFLVPQEPKYVANAIIEILSDPVLGDNLGLAGQEKVKNHFTWEKIALKTENAYRIVLGK